ncbi:MAG: hypothetical protein L0Y56_19490, partial [Nitrospira sp.]|nr:hypothetical protein [Nitrospira sp.]
MGTVDYLQAAPGDLDPTFGTGGKAITDFGGSDQASAIALQANGKIVVAGSSEIDGFLDFALARYNTDGSLDTSFGTAGKVTTDFGGSNGGAFAVALQQDGRIVAAGRTFIFFGLTSDFALARYNTDGSLDTSFGTAGKVTTDFGGNNDGVFAVALQADGKIVAVGSSQIGIMNSDFALARYNPDGSLDSSFGSGGMVTTDFGGDEYTN